MGLATPHFNSNRVYKHSKSVFIFFINCNNTCLFFMNINEFMWGKSLKTQPFISIKTKGLKLLTKVSQW